MNFTNLNQVTIDQVRSVMADLNMEAAHRRNMNTIEEIRKERLKTQAILAQLKRN